MNGYVTIRWCGRSNGCYSQIADRFDEFYSYQNLTNTFYTVSYESN